MEKITLEQVLNKIDTLLITGNEVERYQYKKEEFKYEIGLINLFVCKTFFGFKKYSLMIFHMDIEMKRSDLKTIYHVLHNNYSKKVEKKRQKNINEVKTYLS